MNDNPSQRLGKARQLVASGAIRPTIDLYRFAVKSQTSEKEYTVDLKYNTCTCSDRTRPCKHILAIQLFQAIELEIKRFLTDRPDYDLGKLLDDLNRRNPVENELEKNACFIAVANAMRQPTPTPNPLTNSVAFYLRYWWTGNNPQAAFTTGQDKAYEPEVREPSKPEFRRANGSFEQIVAYIAQNHLTPGEPQNDNLRRHDGNQWQFTVPIYKEN